MYKDQLSPQELETARKELEKMVQEELEDPRVVSRGKMILAFLRGLPMEEITRQFDCSRSMVFRWRARYFRDGISGLRDKPRCGKPPKYDQAFEKKLLALLTQAPPNGAAQWDGPALARQLSASNDAIWRVLRKHHISLSRQREWNVEATLDLPPNFPVVGGIYIGPPVWMVMLLEEENAWGNARVITRERQAGAALRRAAEKAGGDLRLHDALQIMANKSENQTADYSRHMEIINFLNDAAAFRAMGQRVCVHVVGSAAQLGIANWIAAHSDIRLFFYASLEDAVCAIRHSLPDHSPLSPCTFLNQAASYPAQAHPFIWKKVRIEN